ncbi:hypothetical protein DID88_006431 [Monilinia fructigena]|uniref:Rho-GAP domain-containing protein n=1 Tax=Monilinia fructigena TaxID=38457 RepID=A0A395IIU9_9HELO|nr:hypothetical protein DID88_006431 [Monilinia fructigena]
MAPNFADSFWSGDYAGGLGVLFGKLQQGVAENQQVLTIARMRAEAEDAYGMKLGDIGPAADRITGGFGRDDGASVRKAYDGVRTEMVEAAKNHRKIAQSIRDLVVAPFSRWMKKDEQSLEIGDEIYNSEQVKKIMTHLLQTIKLGDTKVPILGTYQNTTSGADIVEYFQKFLGATSVSHAERIGQDLVSHGFLRLIGNVGNVFANSSKMFYQWRPKGFQLTGIPEKKPTVGRTFSVASNSDFAESPVVGSVAEYLAGWNPLNNQHPNETPGDRLRREAAEADERYKQGHLRYLERCELDRLKAIKTIILDFSGTISNVIPSLQSTVDNMMLYQETVQPLGDLRYLLENYRTGGFAPKVIVYENYYNSADEQTFGVDLEARARGDRKRYPDLEGDAARRSVWLVDVPLHQTHRVRDALNTGKPFPIETLEPYEIPIIASVLKLYLLELPDSLVSSHNTLSQLRLANIATLDALMTHFTRLIELTSADEAYISELATILAPCVLRPKTETSMTMEEKYSYRLIRDLFAHKDAIFSELKRASSLNSASNIDTRRPRAISTDESNRRANMEARQKAIIAAGGARSRATSPAPSPRGHRRDRSSGPPAAETRFPVQTSPTATTDSARNSRGSVRQSLEVPSSAEASPVVEPNPLHYRH